MDAGMPASQNVIKTLKNVTKAGGLFCKIRCMMLFVQF